jgi:general secretion pathway protein G
MAAPPALHRRRPAEAGFTLLELIIVVAIIGILATIAMPQLLHTPTKAKEAVLRTDLRTLRDVLDQYYADKGRYPAALDDLVQEKYLRAIPVDPFTRSADTWVPVFEEPSLDAPASAPPPPTDTGGGTGDSEAGKPGIIDVHSGATGTGLNGQAYSEW